MTSDSDFKIHQLNTQVQNDFIHKKQIYEKIKNELFPSVNPVNLILKIVFFHSLSTALVMSFCPQFGLGLFRKGHYGVTLLFMQVSHEFCQLMCGLTLFSLSFIVILLNLKMTEIEWLAQNKYFTFSVLLLLTSSVFWMWAPDLNMMNLILWSIGALISAGGADIRLHHDHV